MTACNRRTFLKAAGAGVLGLSSHGCASVFATEKRARPLNFVFILVDDLGWADPSCYGSRFHETPHIDALAAQGVRFTNAYAAAPLCTATRASILTGKYPARLHNTGANVYPHGEMPKPDGRYPDPNRKGPPWAKLVVPIANGELPLEEVTLAEALRAAGYATACIGKWHLGDAPRFPENQGFDLNFGGYREGWTPTHFYPYRIAGITDGVEGEYMADRLTAEAEGFIDAHRDGPFFLYLAHYAVHTPIEGKQELVDHYRTKAHPTAGQRNPVYAAMVHSVDQSVGRVMAKLDELSIADHTVVFLMSDNGGLLRTHAGEFITSNAPLRGGKAMLYEGGIREPMVVRWPGVTKPGRVCHAPASSIDFYPTMLDMAGVDEPPGHRSDGVSLVPVLAGAECLDRDALYWHFPHYIIGLPGHWGTPWAAIRKGHRKLIKFFEGHAELYDLEADLGEQNDLAHTLAEEAARLEQELDAWLESVEAQMPTPNSAYEPAYERPGVIHDFDPDRYALHTQWTFDSEPGGWRALHDCKIATVDGHLDITSTGKDPFLDVAVTAPKGSVVLHMRARFDTAGAGQLFWRTQNAPPYHRSRSVYFHPSHGDGQWHEYALRFHLNAPLACIRLDPGAGEGKIAVDWIRLYRKGNA